MEYLNTVLIVDDSEMVLKVLSFMIEKAGYTLLTAIDGKTALDFFDGRDIDLVITDLNMPEMNGAEFISEIRSIEYYKHMPIVLFIAGKVENQDKILKTSGATMLFDKNNIKDEIIPAIKKMIG